MVSNGDFNHIQLPFKKQSKPKLFGGGKTHPKTKLNKQNRSVHGAEIKRRANELSQFWKERQLNSEQNELPIIESGIPILLETDPLSDIDFLRGLGFEIVCEIEEGYILVASDDVDLQVLNQKADEFIENIKRNCNSPAKVYALCNDKDRLKKMLSPALYDKWPQIENDTIYYIDIGVSCCGNVKLPDLPKRTSNEDDAHYKDREQKWIKKFNDAYISWDELKIKREKAIEDFIAVYNGKIIESIDGISSIVDLPDSFSARVKVNGRCLRDLVLNFAYIFEVSESEEIKIGTTHAKTQPAESNVNVLAPSNEAPIVCVVDSGIQEEHKFIAPAIRAQDSISMVHTNKDVSDGVADGGHGTRVAGAVLYPKFIPKHGTYELPCWIRNYRILDKDNCIPMDLYPPKVISAVVDIFSKKHLVPTKVFNHSIGGYKSCDLKHMSPWAAELDIQSYENDILF